MCISLTIIYIYIYTYIYTCMNNHNAKAGFLMRRTAVRCRAAFEGRAEPPEGRREQMLRAPFGGRLKSLKTPLVQDMSE